VSEDSEVTYILKVLNTYKSPVRFKKMSISDNDTDKIDKLIYPNSEIFVKAKLNTVYYLESEDISKKNVEEIGYKGSECTCANGRTYRIGVYDNDCSKIACENAKYYLQENLIDEEGADDSQSKIAICTCPDRSEYMVGTKKQEVSGEGEESGD